MCYWLVRSARRRLLVLIAVLLLGVVFGWRASIHRDKA
jgi:hypothetical protein